MKPLGTENGFSLILFYFFQFKENSLIFFLHHSGASAAGQRPGGLFNRLNNFNSKTTAEDTTTTETTSSSNSFQPRTTSRPRLQGGFKPRPQKAQTVKDLLSSIPKDDLGGLLPKDFADRRPSSKFNKRPFQTSTIDSIKQDDVSKFLPPGFKYEETTTSTTTDTSLIEDILSSIEQDDLAKLLPKDFGPLPDFSKNKSRPKPPRLFQKTSETTQKTTEASSEASPSLIDSFIKDDISKFLPPGFNAGSVPSEESTTTTTTTKKPDFKLDISSLFDDIKTDDVKALLPPDFNKPASTRAPTTAEVTTEKIVLKFPTRPGGSATKGDYESATKATGISGPPPFVPKIKSFEER